MRELATPADAWPQNTLVTEANYHITPSPHTTPLLLYIVRPLGKRPLDIWKYIMNKKKFGKVRLRDPDDDHHIPTADKSLLCEVISV